MKYLKLEEIIEGRLEKLKHVPNFKVHVSRYMESEQNKELICIFCFVFFNHEAYV